MPVRRMGNIPLGFVGAIETRANGLQHRSATTHPREDAEPGLIAPLRCGRAAVTNAGSELSLEGHTVKPDRVSATFDKSQTDDALPARPVAMCRKPSR